MLERKRHQQKIYYVWAAMLRRCYTPTNRDYKNYGARGIAVCDRWRIFEAFLADMGEPPAGMTLERVDNDCGYGPENCRWATRKEQAQNFRRNVMIEYMGRTQTLSQWADEMGMSYKALQFRRSKGESGSALFRPVMKRALPSHWRGEVRA